MELTPQQAEELEKFRNTGGDLVEIPEGFDEITFQLARLGLVEWSHTKSDRFLGLHVANLLYYGLTPAGREYLATHPPYEPPPPGEFN